MKPSRRLPIKGLQDVEVLRLQMGIKPNATAATASHRTMLEVPAMELPRSSPVVELRPTTAEQKLNKTERKWLGIMRSRGLVEIGIQEITFKLANDTRYTPDFHALVAGPGGTRLVFYEVKGGYIREDAWIKLKTAAHQYRFFDFVLAQYDEDKWEERLIKP